MGFVPKGAHAEHAHHAAMMTASPSAAVSVHDHATVAPEASSHSMHTESVSEPVNDCMNGHCPACFVDGSGPSQDSPFDMCGSCFMPSVPAAPGVLIVQINFYPASSRIQFVRFEPPPDPVPAFNPAAPSFSLPELHSVLRL
ncbi:hypothetical protein HQ496_09355 [bacterium]|nr:hypothetical protein [bacterium]